MGQIPTNLHAQRRTDHDNYDQLKTNDNLIYRYVQYVHGVVQTSLKHTAGTIQLEIIPGEFNLFQTLIYLKLNTRALILTTCI